MSDVLVVRLHGQDVGEIVRFPGGQIQFEFYPAYATQRDRPTLSQSFLDDEGEVTGGGRPTNNGEVPDFFSNLLPEGELRSYLAAKAAVPETREFELLELLGGDLPGAVEVVNEDPEERRERTAADAPAHRRVPVPGGVLTFSLAGVQLKFSAIEKAAGGLTIPARGMGGDWILKLPSLRFDDIPENEFSIMSLAEKMGIEVPETRLVPVGQIEGLPGEVVNERVADENALAVRRYDRTRTGRIHAEDFAQVLGMRADYKYKRYTYTHFARVLAAFTNERSVGEFSKRLMYAALTGNADLHAKNWSLIYRDGRTPELSPAYDLLCTTPHIPAETMALRLGSASGWRDRTLDDFAAVADAAHIDPAPFVRTAAETAERFRDIWPEASKSLPIPDAVRSAIETKLTTVPAITGAPGPRRRRGRLHKKPSGEWGTRPGVVRP